MKPKSKPKQKPDYIEKQWFQILLLIAVTLIVYLNSFHSPFQFDDELQIVYQESNHSFHNFANLTYWFHVNNRPVSTFTLVANYVLNGDNVFGYHVVNFIIHLLSGIVLFFWLKLITPKTQAGAVSKWLPVVISLYFLVHPAQIQSVTYVVQRMTSMAGMFFLLSVYLYTKGRLVSFKSNKLVEPAIYYGTAIIAGVLATLSKQNAVVFPLAFMLTELFFIRNERGQICKRYLGTALSIVLILAIGTLSIVGLPYETKDISRIQYFATQMVVIPRYFQLMLFPVGLSIDHGVKVVEGFFNLKVIFGALLLAGILVFAIFRFKKQPLVSFGLFWIFIALIVESSIFPIRDVMFDQRMYLPLVGFSIAFWTIVFDFLSVQRPKLLRPVVILVLIGMSVGTFARNVVWQSRSEVWKGVTEMYPHYFRGWQGLGRGYVAEGEKDISKIIDCYEKALEIEPENYVVLNDLATNYLNVNNTEKAMACYRQLEKSEVESDKLTALRILGILNLSKQEFKLAENYLQQAINISPEDTIALQGLTSLYIKTNDFEKSITFSKTTLKVLPGNSAALLNIGYAYINLGKSEQSKKYLLEILNNSPSDINAMLLYANACVNTSKFDDAISYLKRAYQISNNQQLLLDIEKVEKMK